MPTARRQNRWHDSADTSSPYVNQLGGIPTEEHPVLLRSTDGLTEEDTGSIDGITLTHLAVLNDAQLLTGGENPDPDDNQATTGGTPHPATNPNARPRQRRSTDPEQRRPSRRVLEAALAGLV